MKIQQIKFKSFPNNYSIIIGNNILGILPKKIKNLCPKVKKVALIVDKNVPYKIKSSLKNRLKKYELIFLNFNANEKSKSIKTVNSIIEKLLLLNFNRSDLIIGIGGGITGDVTGFVASIFKRGINYINIGPNKDTLNKEEDFYKCLKKISPFGGYVTINISSPNTEGLRDFHDQKELEKLLKGITKIKKDNNIVKPLVVKLSPDINDDEISKIIELIIKYKISGIILSNTTETREASLKDNRKNEKGGLSGQPLRDMSTKLIKKFYNETKGKVQIIGVGGVDSGQAAFEKISSGAKAVQLYTGMVYKGPGVVKDIKKELISILKKENLKNIGDAVGINA